MVTNKTHRLLVTDGTVASDPAAIASGEFAVLDKEGSAVTAISLEDEFQLVAGKANGQLKHTNYFKGKDIQSVRVTPFRAAVDQEVTVSLTAPTEGLDYTLSVLNKSDKEILQRRQDKRSYSVRAKAGETAASLAQAYADMINADEAASVTADVSGDDLVLTAKSFADNVDAAGLPGVQVYFAVSLYEEDSNGAYGSFGTVATTADVDFGSGSGVALAEVERVTMGYDGYLNQRQFPIKGYPTDVNPGAQYDLVTVEFIHDYTSNSVSWGKVNDPIVVTIAVEAGNTTAIEGIFALFL